MLLLARGRGGSSGRWCPACAGVALWRLSLRARYTRAHHASSRVGSEGARWLGGWGGRSDSCSRDTRGGARASRWMQQAHAAALAAHTQGARTLDEGVRRQRPNQPARPRTCALTAAHLSPSRTAAAGPSLRRSGRWPPRACRAGRRPHARPPPVAAGRRGRPPLPQPCWPRARAHTRPRGRVRAGAGRAASPVVTRAFVHTGTRARETPALLRHAASLRPACLRDAPASRGLRGGVVRTPVHPGGHGRSHRAREGAPV